MAAIFERHQPTHVIHLAAKVILKEKEEERVEDSGKTWRSDDWRVLEDGEG